MNADRVLVAALDRAVEQLAQAAELGELVWRWRGTRCYRRVDVDGQDGITGVLTISGGGVETVYEVAGVDLADLV